MPNSLSPADDYVLELVGTSGTSHYSPQFDVVSAGTVVTSSTSSSTASTSPSPSQTIGGQSTEQVNSTATQTPAGITGHGRLSTDAKAGIGVGAGLLLLLLLLLGVLLLRRKRRKSNTPEKMEESQTDDAVPGLHDNFVPTLAELHAKSLPAPLSELPTDPPTGLDATSNQQEI